VQRSNARWRHHFSKTIEHETFNVQFKNYGFLNMMLKNSALQKKTKISDCQNIRTDSHLAWKRND
jgi:hypothetical protein